MTPDDLERPVTLPPGIGKVLDHWPVRGCCQHGRCLDPAVEPGAAYCARHSEAPAEGEP